jgi:hypothetical protein
MLGLNTQKRLNIVRDPRVSVAISGDYKQPLQYKGLSLAGRATISLKMTTRSTGCAGSS